MKYDKIGPTERNERNWLSLRKAGAAIAILAASFGLTGCSEATSPSDKTTVASTADAGHTDQRGYPDVDWKIVDYGCNEGAEGCEVGDFGITVKGCDDNNNLLFKHVYSGDSQLIVIPNSPECGYTPPTAENSPAPTAEATPTPASGN